MERLFESKVSLLQYTATGLTGSEFNTAQKPASGFAEAVTVTSKSTFNRFTAQDVYSFDASRGSGVYIDTFSGNVNDLEGLALGASATAFAMQIASELPSFCGSHIQLRLTSSLGIDTWSYLLLSTRQDYLDTYDISEFVEGFDANSVAYHARVL